MAGLMDPAVDMSWCTYSCPVHPVPASLLDREPSKKAMAMTTEEVVQWLKSINLSKYTQDFQDNEVDGELLASCTLKELEEIGVKGGVDRKKIFLRFRKIE